MVSFVGLIERKGQFANNWLASILIASILSLAFQAVMAETMTSPQCADAHASAMADTLTMAGHEGSTDQSSCCNYNESSAEHDCGNICVISCTNITMADIPISDVTIAAPSHQHREPDSKQPLLQLTAAIIPPPPRT